MMRAALDLVLVNPGSRRRIYQSLGATLTAKFSTHQSKLTKSVTLKGH